jgi:hypothetical protein
LNTLLARFRHKPGTYCIELLHESVGCNGNVLLPDVLRDALTSGQKRRGLVEVMGKPITTVFEGTDLAK